MAKIIEQIDGPWEDVSPIIKDVSKPHREFYIIREFHSLAIIAYGWSGEEAWRRAGNVSNSDNPNTPQYFMTTILVDRPEGW